MKIAIFLSLISFSAFCQDTLFNVQDTVSIAPDGSNRSLKSLPYFAVPVTDKRLREPSMGMNVLSLLRGQMPGVVLNTQFVTNDPFNYNAFMVVDGAPVNSTISDYSSLNTFDYQNPMVITGNAVTPYGMSGFRNGAVLLNSLSGEGMYRGKFSFNTFNTTGWQSVPSGNVAPGQSLSSNSLSYAQDFGRIDVRVSGNYTGGSGDVYYDQGFPWKVAISDYNLKLNTGWYITYKLKARLILEKNSDNRTSVLYTSPIPTPNSRTKHGYESSRANFSLEYEAKPWLKFSTRLQKSSVSNDTKNWFSPGSPVTTLTHDRNLFNLFANFDKQITDHIAVSASTGYQRDQSPGSFAYRINSQINSAGIRYKDQLFIDGSFRIDNSNIDPERNNKTTWSVASGWVFTGLWKTKPPIPYGKLRVSVGHYSYVTIPYYPQAVLGIDGRYVANSMNDSKEYHRIESGTDLLFWNGRVQLTANYTRFSSDLSGSTTTVQEGPLQVSYLDYTRYFTDMQQLAVGAYLNPKKTEFTKLTVTTSQQKKRTPPNKAENLTSGHPYYIDLLHTATLNNFVVNLLLEAYSVTPKENVFGLREVSISYSVLRGFASRRSVDPAVISFVGRGFMNKDENRFITNAMAKSISLGFTVNF